jgi:hypothetical protein
MSERPTVSRSIGNTTLEPSWVESHYSDISFQFQKTGRIINNVTLAWPHPGVATAATSKRNGILQPADLGGIDKYIIKAQVVSPVINMDAEELAPIVHIRWPNPRVNGEGVVNQIPGNIINVDDNWFNAVPAYIDQGDDGDWLNATVVDDIFSRGQKYGRRLPIFSHVCYVSLK